MPARWAFTPADIATGAALGYLLLRLPELDWRTLYPALARYYDDLSQRESFRSTIPVTQNITAKVA